MFGYDHVTENKIKVMKPVNKPEIEKPLEEADEN